MNSLDRLLTILCHLIPLLPWTLLAPALPLHGAVAVPAGVAGSLAARALGRFPSPRLLTAASLLSSAAALSRITLADPVTPLAVMLQLLLGIRLLGEKSGRTILQTAALSILSLAVASVWELGIRYLLVSLVTLTLSGAILVLVTARQEVPTGEAIPAARLLRAALLIPAAALPLAVLLFPLLPRTQHPLWNILPAAGGSRSGTADRVEPGRSDTVTDDPGVVFRAETAPLPPERLYWRVTVFNLFDGVVWRRDPGPPAEETRGEGKRIVQKIFLPVTPSAPLPLLDPPVGASLPRVRRSPDLVFVPTGVRTPLLRYEAVSSDRLEGKPVEEREFTLFYTGLPPVDPRFVEAARQLSRDGAAPAARLRRIEELFQRRSLRYGTTGLAGGSDPAAAFFFDGGVGNCEHFASSFAILARGAGIPARLVGGYLGGDFNPLLSYYLVRGSHAHVWVEVWLEGEGWRRIDPTLFARPFREERTRRRESLSTRISALADSVDYWWNQNVLTYDLARQVQTFSAVGRSLRPLRPDPRRLVVAGAVVTIALLAVAGWKRGLFRRKSRPERLLRRLERLMARRGHPPRRPSEGVRGYAERVGGALLAEFAALYGEGIYREGGIDDGRYARLLDLLERMESGGPGEGPPPAEGKDPDHHHGGGGGDRRQ